MAGHPGTIYGVYKRANESTAAVYLGENGISSTGLRPHTVYGVGRDQGVTSAPTTAMLAAAAGTAFTIPYGGAAQLQLARDVARAFIAASLAAHEGAAVHNLPGRARLDRGDRRRRSTPTSIGFDDVAPAVPRGGRQRLVHGRFPDFAETPLADGVAATVDRFRALLAEGLVQPPAARSLMSNSSFRDAWQARFGRAEPKVVCVGLNYIDHAGESKMEPPKAPLLFGKFANTLCGDGDAIVLPDGVGHVDARGRAGGRDRPHREPASRRTTRSSSSPARRARTTSVRPRLPVRRRPVVPRQEPRHVLPGRPALVPRDELDAGGPADPAAPERRDAAGLAHEPADLRHPDARLVRLASITLERGDLILTGTPEGVGFFREPKIALADGDVVEVEIEGIGVLRNSVRRRERALRRIGSAPAPARLWTSCHDLAHFRCRHVTISPIGSIA